MNFISKLFRGPRAAEGKGNWGEESFRGNESFRQFRDAFLRNLQNCTWEPHPQYSVFTQYDQSHYLQQKEKFMHKYRCFYAVSKTVSPRRILELGTHAGSSADAYLSAAPDAEYIGFDQFEDGVLRGLMHEVHNTPWQPRQVAEQLFAARGFTNYQLIKANLRELQKLPMLSDFIVVDAAHNFDNEYADLKLALTAQPQFIFVDDSDDETQAMPAIKKFLAKDLKHRVEFCLNVDYIGGGLVIKLK